MKLYSNKILILSFLIIFAGLSVEAQEKSALANDPKKVSIDCKSYKYEKPEDFNRDKIFGNQTIYVLELYLKKFLEQCPDSPFRQKATEQLKIVEEAINNGRLSIAKYFLAQSETGKSDFRGVENRLLEIVSRYPPFSKMDEVFFLLVKTYLLDKNFDEAVYNYRRLLNEFYLSPYICEANILIRQAKP